MVPRGVPRRIKLDPGDYPPLRSLDSVRQCYSGMSMHANRQSTIQARGGTVKWQDVPSGALSRRARDEAEAVGFGQPDVDVGEPGAPQAVREVGGVDGHAD